MNSHFSPSLVRVPTSTELVPGFSSLLLSQSPRPSLLLSLGVHACFLMLTSGQGNCLCCLVLRERCDRLVDLDSSGAYRKPCPLTWPRLSQGPLWPLAVSSDKKSLLSISLGTTGSRGRRWESHRENLGNTRCVWISDPGCMKVYTSHWVHLYRCLT